MIYYAMFVSLLIGVTGVRMARSEGRKNVRTIFPEGMIVAAVFGAMFAGAILIGWENVRG